MAREPARARLYWTILSLVLLVKFGHNTAACHSLVLPFSAAVYFTMKRSAPCSAVLRHFRLSWAAVVNWSALMPKALRPSRERPTHRFSVSSCSPRPTPILQTSRTLAVPYPPCAPQIPRTKSASLRRTFLFTIRPGVKIHYASALIYESRDTKDEELLLPRTDVKSRYTVFYSNIYYYDKSTAKKGIGKFGCTCNGYLACRIYLRVISSFRLVDMTARIIMYYVRRRFSWKLWRAWRIRDCQKSAGCSEKWRGVWAAWGGRNRNEWGVPLTTSELSISTPTS